MWAASGGNPFYVTELLRAVELDEPPPGRARAGAAARRGSRGDRARVVAPGAWHSIRGRLGLAQALAVLGDGCELRQAAAIAGVEMSEAMRLAAGLVRLEVLATDDPPRFIHPVVRDALEASLASDERDALTARPRRLLHADGAAPGRSPPISSRAAGGRRGSGALARGRPGGDESGAPEAAADLLRARAGRAAAAGGARRRPARGGSGGGERGRETACARLEEALRLAADPRERAEIALEVAEAYAALFRWVEAVDAIERALVELGEADEALAARLEGELVVCGLHDARRASRVAPVLERLSARSLAGSAAEALAVARGMAMVLAGRRAEQAAAPLEEALSHAEARAENWDTRAALLWSLIAAERFETVEAALGPMLGEVQRSGSARGLVAAYSTLGLLSLRLGALPEADAAARSRCACCRRVISRRGSRSRRPSWPTSRSRRASSMRPGAARAASPGGLAGGRRHGLDPGRTGAAAARPESAGGSAPRLRDVRGDVQSASSGGSRCEMSATSMPGRARRGRCSTRRAQRARELAQAELADAGFEAPRALGCRSRARGSPRAGTAASSCSASPSKPP